VWVDTWNGAANLYYDLFYFMEEHIKSDQQFNITCCINDLV